MVRKALGSIGCLALLGLVGVGLVGLAGCAGGGRAEDATVGGDQAITASPSTLSEPITLANWLTHPAIVEVRNEVNGIDASQLRTDKRTMCASEGVGEFERDKSADASGKIRKLVVQDGDDDGAAVTSYYYDEGGKLRFVFQTVSDVHGNASEMRVYFDATGKRIWDVFRSASDPAHNNPNIAKAPYVAPPLPLVIGPDLANPGAVFDGPPKCG
jgi:hypothetical protein